MMDQKAVLEIMFSDNEFDNLTEVKKRAEFIIL